MVNYAIAKIAGQQYKFSQNSLLTVNRLPRKEGEIMEIPEVLLLKDEENVLIGSPYLKDVKVKAKVIKHTKGEKVDIYKFKAKVRYRRHIGFRPHLTQLKIETIEKINPDFSIAKETTPRKSVSSAKKRTRAKKT